MNDIYRRALILAAIIFIATLIIRILIGCVMELPNKRNSVFKKSDDLLNRLMCSSFITILIVLMSWPLTVFIEYLVNLC